MTTVKIKRIHQDAIIPKYEHKGDAGVDVFSVHDLIINPRERAVVKTGLSLEIPNGYEIQIRPKSGLALKDGITCLNTPGTVDSNYRGELGVILINHSSKPFLIQKGKKIAQLVLNKVENIQFKETKQLSKTSRGAGGFGSTGLYRK